MKSNVIFSSATSQGRQKCYNASDCVGGKYLRFCNHDYDVFGFCEECKTVARRCTSNENDNSCETSCLDEEFLCKNGERSCNETCINLGIQVPQSFKK